MKIRTGFISNSSSSSFIIRRSDLTSLQTALIKNHTLVAENILGWHTEDYNAWTINEEYGYVTGYTMMDNFDMKEFLKTIDVPEDVIKWDYA